MPATRPIWKGQLRLSLVTIAVELYSATKPNAKVSFRQIHKPSGKPVKYEKVVPGVGPVDRDDIMKGFEVRKGDYVLLTDAEIDAVKLETRRTLELTQFVGACDIDPIYFDKAYFVAPADELAEDAFRVVRDALRQTGKVGLGQLALRGKEYLVALKPTGTGMLLETLHYEDEIRKSDPFFASIPAKKADPELLDVAVALMEKKSAPFEATAFKDHYQAALRTLVEEKAASKGKRVSVTPEEDKARPEGDNVIDLMAALKRSLEANSGEKRGAKPKGKASSASTRRAARTTKVKAAPRRRETTRATRKRAG